MNKIKLFVITGAATCAGFVAGYWYQASEISKRDLFIANTVGNNLIEVNKLFSLLARHENNHITTQNKYNLDMLTIIDCSFFIKNIHSSEAMGKLPYFKKGLQEALRVLKANGVDEKDLVLCDSKVLDISAP